MEGDEEKGKKKERPRYQPVVIPLQEPRQLDGKEIEELTMRPPLARDLLNAQRLGDSEADVDAALFANLTDTPSEFIGSLSIFDYRQVETAYGSFLSRASLQSKNASSLFQEAAEPPSES